MPKIKFIIFIFTLIGITFLAYTLRLNNYASVPRPGESMDEYSNSWVGLSLIRLGFPIGMSGMAGYGHNDTRYINVDRVFQSTARGNPFYLNSPWFDHPPLMGIVTGSYAYLKGARVFEDTAAVLIRKPVIWLTTLSVFLTGILAYLLFGPVVAIGSSLLYATVPLFVIHSRFVQAENGLLPLFLTSTIFLALYLKKDRYLYLFLAALTAGLATLFKLSGIAVILTASIILCLNSKSLTSKIQDLFFFLVVAFSLTSLFLIFGTIMGWHTFTNVLTDNSTRFYGLGAAAIQNLFLEPRVTHTLTLTDHWPIALWLGFFIYLSLKRQPEEPILPAAVISYLITYLFFGSWPYGWYTIPFWPFLTIIFIRLLTTNPSLLVSSLLLLFPITQILTRFINIRNFQSFSTSWRFIISFLILGLYLKFFPKLHRFWLLFLFCLAVYLNLKFLGTINVDTWLKIN